jgi:hypothetical protein
MRNKNWNMSLNAHVIDIFKIQKLSNKDNHRWMNEYNSRHELIHTLLDFMQN